MKPALTAVVAVSAALAVTLWGLALLCGAPAAWAAEQLDRMEE